MGRHLVYPSLKAIFLNWPQLIIGAGLGIATGTVYGQTTSLPSVKQALQIQAQSSDVSSFQMEQFLMSRIPALPKPSRWEEWTAQQERLRRHTLDEVAYHGWPHEWVVSPPDFEQVGVIETSHGYRIRKLRYEIVPGFLSTALLYEPQEISGRSPSILNALGQEPAGTAVEYEQVRCINFVKRGIVTLALEWPAFGDLSQEGNLHDYGAQLNLVGLNVLGFHYLAMRRGLDYLATLPEVDPTRIGMTGLSGGGWQTVLLSALDERVAVSVEVAGIGSRESNLARPHDTDEVEESAPDLMRGEDYPEFIAMRAPRPTLLIHNAVDSCCFRARLVKPYIYDNVKQFFQLYGASDALQWHENFDPGTHNYQLDNREQAYRFFSREFHLPAVPAEIFSNDEIRKPQELAIEVPADNLTILALARKLAGQIKRETIPASGDKRSNWVQLERKKLKAVVHYDPVSTVQALMMSNGLGLDFHFLAYRFGFSNGLGATGIWLQENAVPQNQSTVIVLNDKGYEFAEKTVSEHVDRGEQVLALNLLFNGLSAPGYPDPTDWTMLTDGSGSRALGLEVAQLISVGRWIRSTSNAGKIHVETDGIRSQVMALTAAAIAPDLFSAIVSRNAMESLTFLLDTPVPIRSAPELFCLDLYQDYDLNVLEAIASPVKIISTQAASAAGPWKLKQYTP